MGAPMCAWTLVTTRWFSVLRGPLGRCDLWPLSFLESCQVGGSPCYLKENVLRAAPLTRPVAAGSQSVGRASLHMGAPTSLSWAPQGGGSRVLVPGPPPLPSSPSLLPKEGVCLPCPLLLQPHRSLNPELSEPE